LFNSFFATKLQLFLLFVPLPKCFFFYNLHWLFRLL
jgi:hypothetical protein